MNILITGGAGFIGSHLSAHLLQKQHRITIVDNFHPYYSPKRKMDQLNKVRQKGDITLLKVDLCDVNACKALFQEQSFDAVIHLAAIPGVSYSFQVPHTYMDLNVNATVNVLRWAGETKVKHVIFASSSSVYGDQQGYPLSEQMINGKVISPYAASKVGAESMCHVYEKVYGYHMTILRFFTVYGPWGRPDMAISKFITKLMNNEAIEVYGLDSARDYTYIDDIVFGIEKALARPDGNQTYNLGYGSPVSMGELLDCLRIYFPTMEVNLGSNRTGDVQMTWANTEKAKGKLNFIPRVSIEDGIERTVFWAKRQLEK